jgi:ribosomal protein S18 acetylase RimI-like enzyme
MPRFEAQPETIVVREADLGDPVDAGAVLALVDAYATDPFGGGRPLDDTVRARLVPGLRAHPTTLVLLALVAGRPVGVAVCFFGFSTFQARPLLNVHDLAVLPDSRGHGVGRALLAAAEERARARGCCKLTLEVLEDNHRARALYAGFGFADVAAGSPVATRFVGKRL